MLHEGIKRNKESCVPFRQDIWIPFSSTPFLSLTFNESTYVESAPKPEKLWNFFSFPFNVSSLLFRKLFEQIFYFWFILWLTSKFHLSGPLFRWSHFCMVWPATSRRHNPGNTWPQEELGSQVLALELTWHLITVFRDRAPVNHPYFFLPAENNSPSPKYFFLCLTWDSRCSDLALMILRLSALCNPQDINSLNHFC